VSAVSETQRSAQSANWTVQVRDRPSENFLEGERKTVTALFADIKGSTSILEKPDREEARALVEPVFELKIGAVRRYEFIRLAEAQALDGAIDDALSTIEDGLQANPGETAFRPNALSLRGELRLKIGQAGAAETDFREANELGGPRHHTRRRLVSSSVLIVRDKANSALEDALGHVDVGTKAKTRQIHR